MWQQQLKSITSAAKVSKCCIVCISPHIDTPRHAETMSFIHLQAHKKTTKPWEIEAASDSVAKHMQ